MQNSFLNVLKYPDFRKMWLSQLFSQIALNMVTFALVLHIFELTGKATSVSLVMLASAIPVALIGPFSGVLADKLNYKKIMICTNFSRFIAAGLLLVSANNTLALLEIIFLISAISQIFTPAESASVPLTVPKDRLVPANSVVMTTTYATLLVGYSLAGPVLNLVGPLWLFFICAILFVAATVSTYMLSDFDKKVPHKLSIVGLATSIDRIWDEVIDSVKYLIEQEKIFRPMIKLTIGWVILGAIITLLPSYGADILKVSPRFVGPIVVGPAGLGMLISTLFINRGKQKVSERTINKGFVIVGCSLLIFALYFLYQHFFWAWPVLIASIILVGFGCSMIQIPAQTLLHIHSDEDKRGRVFGISSMQLRLATALPALVIGGVSDLTSPLITMILIAVLVFAYSMILLFE